MRYNKHLNRLEHKQQRQAKLLNDISGKGLYVFENNTSGDLQIPGATTQDRLAKRTHTIKKGSQFEGDDYFFSMLRTHDLKLIKELQSGESMNKLITEQPPVVTQQGTVEFVQPEHGKQKLNEQQPNKKEQQNVLLTEDPLAGVVIVD